MGQADSIKIVVADDHPLVLDGVRTVLERLDASAEILEAHDYPGLLALIEQNPNLALIVMDLSMPGRNGTEGLKEVQRAAPTTPVAVLSGTEDRQTIRNTIESGVAGYIFKSSGGKELLAALNLILQGDTYLPDGLSLAALQDLPSIDNQGLETTVGFAALNHLPVGVLVVEGDGKVIFKNRCASEIIAQSDGIEVGPTQICRASQVDETKQLHALIDDVVAEGDGGALSLSRPSMLRALSVVVAPLGRQDMGETKGLAAVFVSDPERQPAPQKETLMRLYELTDAEARLVQALVTGKRLETVAEEFNVSMNTVRSHLKQAFRKTETNRQSELVKLVLTGSAALAVSF